MAYTEKQFIQNLANCYKANTLTWDEIQGLVMAKGYTTEKENEILEKVEKCISKL